MARYGTIHKGGRPKGTKGNHTLKAANARKYFIKRVIKEIDPLISAKLELAKGRFIFMKKKIVDGKEEWSRISNDKEIERLIKNNEPNTYQIWSKDPDSLSLRYLFDQVIGKAKETVEMSGKDGNPLRISWE